MKHRRVCTRCKWLHVRRIVCRKGAFWFVETRPGSTNGKDGPAFCRLLTKGSLSISVQPQGAKCRGREPQPELLMSFWQLFAQAGNVGCNILALNTLDWRNDNPNAFSPYLDIIGGKERRRGLRNSFCNQKTQHNHILQPRQKVSRKVRTCLIGSPLLPTVRPN